MDKKNRKITACKYAELIANDIDYKEKCMQLREELGFHDFDNKTHNDEENIDLSLKNYDRVGVWKKKVENGVISFIKDSSMASEFHLWARAQKIPPKSEKYRIAFLGESAARGFLYDPYINPAYVLESILNENMKKGKAEVIDLARTDLNMDMLLKLIGESILVNPDAIVIYAGNNWRDFIDKFTVSEKEELCLYKDPMEISRNIKKISERRLEKSINKLMCYLNEISQKYNIPITFIIPEFNLKDWNHDLGDELFPLNKKHSCECMKLKKEIEQDLKQGYYYEAEHKAKELLKFDDLNPLSYEFMGRCYLKLGNDDQARKCFEQALDMDLNIPYSVPACHSITRRILKEKSNKYKFSLIDMPVIFKETLNGGIPGNDYFIDYCHLTLKGMTIVMKHTALSILKSVESEKLELEDIQEDVKAPDNEALSKVHFFAAIHCAHRRSQSYKILYYHCLKAVQLSEKISKFMESYIDMATRKIPWIYNKEFNLIINDNLINQYPLIVQNIYYSNMELILTKAMSDALKAININIEDKIKKLRYDEHNPYDNDIDLLCTYYRADSYYKNFIFNNPRPIKSIDITPLYVNVIDNEQLFYLIADKQYDINLQLTCKDINKKFPNKRLRIKANDKFVAEAEIKGSWDDISCIVSKETLKDNGINEIILECVEDNSSYGIKEKEDKDLDRMILSRYKPVYYQLIRFKASSAGKDII